jgi:hypothetical protein
VPASEKVRPLTGVRGMAGTGIVGPTEVDLRERRGGKVRNSALAIGRVDCVLASVWLRGSGDRWRWRRRGLLSPKLELYRATLETPKITVCNIVW